MSLRCGCPNGRDEIVFGPVHQCTPAALVRLERAFVAVAEMTQQDFTLSVGDLVATGSLDTPEPRYMETLDADERTGH